VVLRASGHTEKGSFRTSNEDCFAIDERIALCLVADGMGGHNAGEVAARLAVQTVLEFIRAQHHLFAKGSPLDSITWPYGFDPQLSDAGNCLRTAVHVANARIVEASQGNAEYSGMGTTLIAAFVWDGRLTLAHAGDSRCYLLAHDGLRLLTRDDSWAEVLLQAEGPIDPAVVQHHPMRNALTNVVGTRPDLLVHVAEVPLSGNERLLLSTDGVHGILDDEWITRLLRTDDLRQAAVGLVDAALSRGSRDNCTAVVARYCPDGYDDSPSATR
jgi:protein phosphatase